MESLTQSRVGVKARIAQNQPNVQNNLFIYAAIYESNFFHLLGNVTYERHRNKKLISTD